MRLSPAGTDPAEIKVLFQQMEAARLKTLRRGAWEVIESPRSKQALQKLGFDSFYVREVVDRKPYKNMGVFDASKVEPEAADVTSEEPTDAPVSKHSQAEVGAVVRKAV